MIIVFCCSENQNKYQEEVELPDDATDDDIQEEYEQWVWEQVGDRFSWHKKEDGDDA